MHAQLRGKQIQRGGGDRATYEDITRALRFATYRQALEVLMFVRAMETWSVVRGLARRGDHVEYKWIPVFRAHSVCLHISLHVDDSDLALASPRRRRSILLRILTTSQC